MAAIKIRILLILSLIVFLFVAWIVFFKQPVAYEQDLRSGLLTAGEPGFSNKPSRSDSVELYLLISQVSTYKSVECAYIGYAGTPSTQFDPTGMMKSLASDSQLIHIIDKATPIVKHFAFRALLLKNPGLAKEVFVKNLNNKITISFLCGCLGDQRPVNIDFYNCLKENILTPFEKQFYRNELLKQYEGFYLSNYIL